jgi:hypothetical protein
MILSSSPDDIKDTLRRTGIGRAVRDSLENWSWSTWIYLIGAVAISGFVLQLLWQRRKKAAKR